jgi:hypothetical protein
MRPSARSRAKQLTVAALLLSPALGGGCTALSEDASSTGVTPTFGTGGGSQQFVEGGTSTGGQGGSPLSPLCGPNYSCGKPNPDDPFACKDFSGSGEPIDAGSRGAGGASSGGAFGNGGAVASGGSSGTRDGGVGEADAHDGSSSGFDASDASDGSRREGGSPSDAALDRGGADRSSPDHDSGTAEAGDSSNPGTPDSYVPPVEDAGPRYSCQVALPQTSGAGGSTASGPFMQCLPAGDGKSGSGCRSSADCRAGLACAGFERAGVGQCLPYCCDPTTSCEKAWLAGGGEDSGPNLYCGQRSLIDGSQRSTLRVPVCVLADRCNLRETYPCTGNSCQCLNGTACTVVVVPGDGGSAVRATTVCAVPGKGRANEPCSSANPCAAGYFCSVSSKTCLKICNTGGPGAECAPGYCQGPAGFPDNWGVCVGAVPAAK